MESYFGYIKTPEDAICLFEACRKGQLNTVQRRLTAKERLQIKSGSIFVWDENEACMRRWTDGRIWSPSRVVGHFLTYKELDIKSPKRNSNKQYKRNGLIKQSFSISTNENKKFHLICYFKKQDILTGKLQRPKLLVDIPIGLYPSLTPVRHGSTDSNLSDTSSLTSSNSIPSPSNSISTPSSLTSSIPSISSINFPILSFPQSCNNVPTLIHPHTILFNSSNLPIQDIAWEKLPSSEDLRQLDALKITI